MIQVTDLRKHFRTTCAVDGVSFIVRRAETFGLLGPNGAGKTTLINMLVGVLAPDHGTVLLGSAANGDDTAGGDPRSAEARRMIGVAPQTLSLYQDLTAAENLTFYAKLYRLTGSHLRERVDWALEFAGLEERRKDRVKTFSGGMQRRLNLAVALVHDPEIILMDEPTVGVDPQSRNHIFERIESLKERGRTIIYTTHYMEEAQRLCDRVAIMDHGKILDLDSVDALLTRHGGHSVIKAQLQSVPNDASVLPGELDGLAWRYESERPLEEIGRLANSGVAFQTLEVTRPDLETVFLSLTGRRLRD